MDGSFGIVHSPGACGQTVFSRAPRSAADPACCRLSLASSPGSQADLTAVCGGLHVVALVKVLCLEVFDNILVSMLAASSSVPCQHWAGTSRCSCLARGSRDLHGPQLNAC
jgi:hypothetical protein